MEKYINPKDYLDSQKKKREDTPPQLKFPETPQKDILQFLIQHAPITSWQKRILEIVRAEAYYFAPQRQTKIMNEGWASYWHSKMMTQLAPLTDAEIVDYCDQMSGILATPPGGINPYKLGIELFRHIEERWDKGRFGIDWSNCADPREREKWDKQTGLGKEKIFEVRKIHNDITFLDDFLDEEFCHTHKMFIYDLDKRTGKYVISSRDFKEIKQRLLQQLTNFGTPIIHATDGNYKNRGELLLDHTHEGMDLKQETAVETLRNLFLIWKRPVGSIRIV